MAILKYYDTTIDEWVAFGVSDHGDLAGLTDDDHTQYHNNSRGDARYPLRAELDDAVTARLYTGGGVMTGPIGMGTNQIYGLATGTDTSHAVNKGQMDTAIAAAHTGAAPASATATGVTGTIVTDANYIYVCTATNTWKRVAIATW